MTYKEACTLLYDLQHHGIKLGLRNITLLLSFLGNPHNKYPSIHIAGTSGKGSCAHMLDAVLQRCGYQTGLYTSPHLIDFRERIKVSGRLIPRHEVVHFVSKSKKLFTRYRITFFEATTALAFYYFANKKINIAIVEVGLGGTYDSTNVLTPLVSVITPIDYDHLNYLGTTLSSIAREKAGIIKKNIPVVSAKQRHTALKVIKSVASTKKVPLYESDQLNSVKRVRFTSRGLQITITDWMHNSYSITTPLFGEHQITNIATVITTCTVLKILGWSINTDCIPMALSLLHIRGRTELLRQQRPWILLDIAHNQHKINALVRAIQMHLSYRKLYCIVGIMEDKNKNSIFKKLETLKPVIVVTQPKIERAENIRTLEKVARKYCKTVRTKKNVKDAISFCLKDARAADLICITGSVYTVGEAQPHLLDWFN